MTKGIGEEFLERRALDSRTAFQVVWNDFGCGVDLLTMLDAYAGDEWLERRETASWLVGFTPRMNVFGAPY